MKRNIVVFDGYCIMCSKYVLWLTKRNKTKNIYFTHFESKYIKENLPEIKLGNTVFVINENKQILVRSKAVKHCINQTDINPIFRLIFNIIPTCMASNASSIFMFSLFICVTKLSFSRSNFSIELSKA